MPPNLNLNAPNFTNSHTCTIKNLSFTISMFPCQVKPNFHQEIPLDSFFLFITSTILAPPHSFLYYEKHISIKTIHYHIYMLCMHKCLIEFKATWHIADLVTESQTKLSQPSCLISIYISTSLQHKKKHRRQPNAVFFCWNTISNDVVQEMPLRLLIVLLDV